MSEDATTPSNAKLDEIIKGATTSAEMTELLRQYNLEQSARGAQAPPPSVTPTQPDDLSWNYEVLYLGGNDRVEISAHSAADLQRKKLAIYQAYGIKK
jgi:hypothetical protein